MFFSGLFQRKSDAPVTTPAELADAIGLSYDTYTGKQISSQRAMRLTAVFSCVRVLAESVGMLPCNLYHLNGSLKQRATGERLHKLISTHPNGYMTPQEFWELVVTCLCLRGNFYAYKVKAFGEVAELLPVDPGCVVSRCTGQRSSEVSFRSEDIRDERESVGNQRRILKNGCRIIRQFGGVIGIIGVCFKR